jgi:hypothetical protein
MNYSTKQKLKHFLVVRLQLLVVLSCVGLALVGQVPGSSGGWLACPPAAVSLSQAKAKMGLCLGLAERGVASASRAESDDRAVVVSERSVGVGVVKRVTVVGLAVATQPLGLAGAE